MHYDGYPKHHFAPIRTMLQTYYCQSEDRKDNIREVLVRNKCS